MLREKRDHGMPISKKVLLDGQKNVQNVVNMHLNKSILHTVTRQGNAKKQEIRDMGCLYPIKFLIVEPHSQNYKINARSTHQKKDSKYAGKKSYLMSKKTFLEPNTSKG